MNIGHNKISKNFIMQSRYNRLIETLKCVSIFYNHYKGLKMFSKISRILRMAVIKVKLLPKTGKIIVGKRSNISLSTRLKCKNGILKIGEGFHTFLNVNICASQDGKIVIGDGVFFNHNCTVISKKNISIGNGCSFGPNVCVYDHDHRISAEGYKPNEFVCSDVNIGNGCWIGANSVILRGSKIGNNCVIGAGCVIKGDIPDNTVVTTERSLKTRSIC